MYLIDLITYKNDFFISDKNVWYMSCGLLGSAVIFFSFVYLKILFTPLNQTKQTIVKNPTQLYIDKYKDKFELSYKNGKFNQNIEQEFYDKEKYNQIIETKDNILEQSWKKRILFENTPQGNVIMFYDAYKLSFSYYADNNIPYNILNAVAMKYVLTYFCRDFFIDKYLIPLKHTSPFLHVHEIDKKDTNVTKPKIDVTKGPFAKFKNYTKDNKEKPKEVKKDSEKTKEVKNFIKNKYISLGKTYNFSMITKIQSNIPKKREIIPLKYESFKKWHTPSQFKMVNDKDYELDALVS